MDSSATADTPRVCVFTSAHDCTDSRVMKRECATLDEAGYDVTYYTPFVCDSDVDVDVVTYADAVSGRLPDLRDRFSWAARVARLLVDTDYDIYHFHDVEVLPVGVALGLLTDGVVIYDVHENVEDVLRERPVFPEPIRPFMAAAASITELGLAAFADAIVAASPDIAQRFEAYDDVTTVTNYPRRRWAEETDAEHRSPSPEGEPVRFIYRGLLSEERGIHTLLAAVEQVPDELDVELVLGGRYASDAIEALVKRRAAESDRVDLVEWLPSLEDGIDLYRDCDVGMMCFHPGPNRNDAVHRSNKLFQYMAAGLPIVVSDVGEWSRLVEDLECGVAVDPERPDEIADTMTGLARDPDRRAALAERGHRAALDRYNWETQGEALLDLYERLTGVEPGSRSTAIQQSSE